MVMSGHASGASVVGVTLAMTILAAMVVFARLFARVVVVRNAGLDDAFIVGALLFSVATTVTMILQVKWGMGRHIATLSLHEGIQSQKAFYISIWVYNLSMSCTKLSILLQYLRIFPHPFFRKACYVMIAIVSLYSCWTFLSAVFACWPISYFWTMLEDPTGGRCLNRFAVWFANAGINIGTDLAIGVLPLKVLRGLELPRRQRVALMVVFGLGGFTCVVSILRLESLYVISKAKDVTWENPLAAIWSSVEINTGILCSCLPTLRSCVSRIFPKLLGSFRSAPSNEDGHAKGNTDESGGSRCTGSEAVRNGQGSRNLGYGNNDRRMSLEALRRDLGGWNDVRAATQISHSHNSSDDVDLHYLSPYMSEGGRIQVTTTVEQESQPVRPMTDTASTRSLVRPVRSEEHLGRPGWI